MSRRSTVYRLVLTRDRRFIASSIVVANDKETDVSTNVVSDPVARGATATILLVTLHNLLDDDGDKATVAELLVKYGQSRPSPVAQKEVTYEEVLDEMTSADDIPF